VLYRVAQEAITNVVKHSAAHTARVTLSYEDRSVRLIVADDGSGFSVDPDRRTYAGHWGLLGMRERASQLRGRLVVRSAPGAGTKVVLRVPSRGEQLSRGVESPASTQA
jgi:signal transduction histidine kinase